MFAVIVNMTEAQFARCVAQEGETDIWEQLKGFLLWFVCGAARLFVSVGCRAQGRSVISHIPQQSEENLITRSQIVRLITFLMDLAAVFSIFNSLTTDPVHFIPDEHSPISLILH